MVSRRLAATMVSLALSLGAGPALARGFVLPKVGYSAERLVQSGDRWQKMQVHYAPGMERMELEGSAAAGNVMIVRYDKGVTWIVMPQVHAYLEFAADIGNNITAVAESLELRPVGHERIEGMDTVKYEVDGKLKGFMWLGQRDIPVRIDGAMKAGDAEEATPTHFEQSRIAVAPQDPGLFELPQGYMRIELKDPRWLGMMQQFIGGR